MRRFLYLGTDPKEFAKNHPDGQVIHYPMIKIIRRDFTSLEIQRAFEKIPQFSHLIFTSKNTVRVFFDFFHRVEKKKELLADKKIWAIGTITAAHLEREGLKVHAIAEEETQEGIMQMMFQENLKEAYFFWPRSSSARPALVEFLESHKICFLACDLYDTLFQCPEPLPDFEGIDEIVFTSPTTVEAFFQYFSPSGKTLTCIGPITENALMQKLKPSAIVTN